MRRSISKHIYKTLIAVGLSSIAASNVAIADENDVLIIGDSLSCGPFGAQVVRDLLAKGKNVDLYCAVSSSAESWVKGENPRGQICQKCSITQKDWSDNSALQADPCHNTVSQADLKNHFRKHQPFHAGPPTSLNACGNFGKMPPLKHILKKPYAQVIIALGANSAYGTADENYATLANEVTEKIKSCLWIGPPNSCPSQHAPPFSAQKLTAYQKGLPLFYSTLKEKVNDSCSVADSRPVTIEEKAKPFTRCAPDTTRDGLHRKDAAGIEWADKIMGPAFRLGTIDENSRPEPATVR